MVFPGPDPSDALAGTRLVAPGQNLQPPLLTGLNLPDWQYRWRWPLGFQEHDAKLRVSGDDPDIQRLAVLRDVDHVRRRAGSGRASFDSRGLGGERSRWIDRLPRLECRVVQDVRRSKDCVVGDREPGALVDAVD